MVHVKTNYVNKLTTPLEVESMVTNYQNVITEALKTFIKHYILKR